MLANKTAHTEVFPMFKHTQVSYLWLNLYASNITKYIYIYIHTYTYQHMHDSWLTIVFVDYFFTHVYYIIYIILYNRFSQRLQSLQYLRTSWFNGLTGTGWVRSAPWSRNGAWDHVVAKTPGGGKKHKNPLANCLKLSEIGYWYLLIK